MTINEWVRKVRKDAGLSLRAVSEESGLAVATIFRYEDGTRKVSLRYLHYWIEKGYEPDWKEIRL